MRGLSTWVEHRSAPVVATMAAFVLVMGYTLLAHPLLHIGHGSLVAPGDLWNLADSSRAILHGQFSRIYVPNGALTSPPGLEVVLAPFIGLGELVGLSPHLHATGQPLSMWLVVGPAATALACSALFALDAAARRWEFSVAARLALALVGGVGVANVTGGWGHPEDCVALAFVIWAALAMDRDGAAAAPRAALLLGVAIAFQPLAVLGVAPVLARMAWRAAARLWWRLLVPSAAVLVPPLLAETNRTLFVLTHQPFQPRYISFTPLTHLAPVLGPDLDGGGPTRLIATALAATLAIVVCHRRHDLVTVLTMTAAAFFLRVVFETELNWYYLWPVPALCLLLALRKSWPRFWTCAVAFVASMVLGNRQVHHIALWWPALMLSAVVMLLTIGPPPRRWLELARGYGAVALPRHRIRVTPPA